MTVHARDEYTYQHSMNVGYYAWKIAKHLGLEDERSSNIFVGGLLHDIGKIGTPDYILLKNSNLTPEEYFIMKQHALIGYEIVRLVTPLRKRGIDQIVLYHHERMDGQGYPEGLYAKDIPLEALIVSVADSYDAMTTARKYRPALTHNQAVEQLLLGKGTQYDAAIVDVFLEAMSHMKLEPNYAVLK